MTAPKIGEIILEVIGDHEEAIKAEVVIKEVLLRVETTVGTIRNELAKLKNSGKLVQPQNAYYALPDHAMGAPLSGDGASLAVTLTIYDLAASGPSNPITREEASGYYPIALIEIESLYTSRPEKPFVVKMIGESMEPEFRSGDRLIVEPYPEGSKKIQESAIYLFRMEDMIEVKQLQRLPGGGLQISTRNVAYPIREISDSEEADYEIIGRVWGKFKRY